MQDTFLTCALRRSIRVLVFCIQCQKGSIPIVQSPKVEILTTVLDIEIQTPDRRSVEQLDGQRPQTPHQVAADESCRVCGETHGISCTTWVRKIEFGQWAAEIFKC